MSTIATSRTTNEQPTTADSGPAESRAVFLANNFKSLLLGILFGIVLIKSEVVSWYRIQEMFRFQSFHMFGVLGSAVAVGAISIWLIRRYAARTTYGAEIVIPYKPLTKGSLWGGLAFGLGWAMTGACPGPIYALIGSGHVAMFAVLGGALTGAYVYGLLRPKLPH
jgi:uncharacterized membrane protein YedE/YeeE